ncbi:22.7 kDa class IV heat shock protein-like [Dioscorea cayenensis subsp. rotundata]|uniref:22.7 kDa class IV heat shock protein-like n=1 Tax=Dioscorea cayennensis subsp. rotundata TaxID=55577 RepID=A0AB40C701_DIOCR|nr:22.7 kDa class IV heat shock protein-like [Dioscorea cayenensis subsp. rotundata]
MADGTANNNSQRFFEDFNPRSEWVHEEKGDILIIDVSGFTKDQLKVFFETNGRISVSGERLVEGKKWIKFRKEFSKPDNCDVNEIKAKFDCGILYVILPKQNQIQDQDQNQNQQEQDDEEPKSKPTITTTTVTTAAEESNMRKNDGKEIMDSQTNITSSGPYGESEVVRHIMGGSASSGIYC